MNSLLAFLNDGLAAPWLARLAQAGLVVWLQTSLLLAAGLGALRVIQARKPGARTFVARALMLASVAVAATAVGLSLGHQGLPALWQMPLAIERPASIAASANSPAGDLALPDTNLPEFDEPMAVKPEAVRPEAALQPNVARAGREVAPLESRARTLSAPAQQAPREEMAPRSAISRATLWLPWLGAIWLGGATVSLLWLGAGQVALWRLRRRAQPVQDVETLAVAAQISAELGLKAPLLLADAAAGSPFLCGLWRPAIVLPLAWTPTPEVLRAVLLHELMHLQRRDLWWHTASRCGCVLAWPQPLWWILCRLLEQIGEEACDSAVLESGCAPRQYAGCLLDWAQSGAPRRVQNGLGIGVLTGRSSLSKRIAAIMSANSQRQSRLSCRTQWLLGGAIGLAATLTPLLVSLRAAPRKGAVTAPVNPRLKVIGDWAVSVGAVQNGLLRDVTLEWHPRGFLAFRMQTSSAHPAQKWQNAWIFDAARQTTFESGKAPSTKQISGVIQVFPPALSKFLQAKFEAALPQTSKSKPPLEDFVDTEGYRIGIVGIVDGVFQDVSITQKKRGQIVSTIVARTLRRASSGWVLSDGAGYNFDPGKGLTSQFAFQRMDIQSPIFSDAAAEAFLMKQLGAASESRPAAQWSELYRRSLLPTQQLARLGAWAKKQGGAMIFGRVLDDESRPVSGAKIYAILDNATFERICGEKGMEAYRARSYLHALPRSARDLFSKKTLSGRDGSYRFTGMATALYRIGASVRALELPASRTAPPRLVPSGQQIVNARAARNVTAPVIKLTRGGLLHVRVIDKTTGVGLPNLLLFATISDMSKSMIVSSNRTDFDGSTLLRLPASKSTLSVGSLNNPQLSGVTVTPDSHLYDILSGSEMVVDGVTRRFSGATPLQVFDGKTREVVVRLKPYVERNRFHSQSPVKISPPPPGKATLTGRVVDENGRGVGGARVLAYMQKKAQWGLTQSVGLAGSTPKTPHVRQRYAAIRGVIFERATTRADGSFRLDGLTSAPYDVFYALPVRPASRTESLQSRVTTSAQGVWAKESRVVSLAAPLVLRPGALIEGQILDSATGAPLAGVVVSANGPQLPASSGIDHRITSDDQGRYAVCVAPGISDLAVVGPVAMDGDLNLVFEGTRKSAESVMRIGAKSGFYAGSEKVRYEIDGGKSRFGLSLFSPTDRTIKMTTQVGQTHHLTLHLRRLVPAR